MVSPEDDQRPVLAVDVDGVISLFGFDGPLDDLGGRFHLIDGMPHCISDRAGPQLLRLAEVYELVWATGWEARANDHLPLILGLAGDLPVLTFNGRAQFGTAHWKLEALDEYSRDRPLAWIDDSLDASCHAWAAAARRAHAALPHRAGHRDHRGPHGGAPDLGSRRLHSELRGPPWAGRFRASREWAWTASYRSFF